MSKHPQEYLYSLCLSAIIQKESEFDAYNQLEWFSHRHPGWLRHDRRIREVLSRLSTDREHSYVDLMEVALEVAQQEERPWATVARGH
jgi:hypothetical protein